MEGRMYLTETHVQVRDMARDFADQVIRPVAEGLDRDETFPAGLYDEMAKLGLFGIGVPEALGGPGFDTLTYALVMEELSRGYASVADQCGLLELISTLLVRHGTARQQALLGDILAMKTKVAYCITEAEAVADLGFVLARTDKEAGNRGMSIFIVDLHAAGVTRGPKEHKMGQRASQVGGLDFKDVRLGPDALLGAAGRGFHMMMSVLDKGRVGIASLAVGIGQAGLEAAVEYAGQRRQFGKAISEFQGVQWLLADMAKDIEAARLLVQSAAVKIDRGEDATKACSMAKCFAGDMAVARTADAVQVFGGSGYIRGFEVERLYRDAKITQIYEGTNQIQRMIIARELLKKGARA